MRSLCTLFVLLVTSFGFAMTPGDKLFRPPSVPLVACDPYLSIWSPADHLFDKETVHWTGRPQAMRSWVKVDGIDYRLMGESVPVRAAVQNGLKVFPTRTIYGFSAGPVSIRLTFMTPALPQDIEMLSRPITYLTWTITCNDGKAHDVKIHFDLAAGLCVDDLGQKVRWNLSDRDGLYVGKCGTVDQPVLAKVGDSRAIDWGYAYVAVPSIAANSVLFVGDDGLPKPGDVLAVGPASDAARLGINFDLPNFTGTHSRWIVLGYDDLYSIQYFHENLKAYWKRNGCTMDQLIRKSVREYRQINKACSTFDHELMNDLSRLGGRQYALTAGLAFRQCFAGCKIAADRKGQPLIFPKENTSNGCIGTVDVVYPMAPQFLLFGSKLAKATLVANLDYGSSTQWPWPFAPHDLGTYPRANGQVYGGGERTEEDQMPVEETGNMLILVDAVCRMDGNAKFALKYWPTLTRWATFLREKGYDPDRQLSTDDFIGHLAHNTNLSVKAAIGLACYADLARMAGFTLVHNSFRRVAEENARKWVEEAWEKDHFRLAFDLPGSWSQKYNMVWDRILGLNLFPEQIKRKEMAFYRSKLSEYGLGLDSRQNGVPAKVDWTVWTATLTGDRSDFQALFEPVYRYVCDSPQRVALGDLYDTRTGNHLGMHTRPVVGGLMLPALNQKSLWQKWYAKGEKTTAPWASLPKRPRFETVIPTSSESPVTWRYVLSAPPEEWTKAEFDDSTWSNGVGPFASAGTPGITVGTSWTSGDIWLRREFTLTDVPVGQLFARIYHDEDVEVYINGNMVTQQSGYVNSYEEYPLDAVKVQAALRPGKNLLCVHCHQTTGGQGVDVGLVKSKS